MPSVLDTDIKFLKGVGEARGSLLDKELGIRTFRDLLYYFPTRYLDRSRFYKVSEFTPDIGQVQVKGKFLRFSIQGEGARRRLVGLFHDGMSVMEVVWFRRINKLQNAYLPGKEYVLFCKPQYFGGAWSMVHPEIESADMAAQPGGHRGVYPLTEKARNAGITSKTIHTLVDNLKAKLNWLPEALPQELVSRLKLMPLREALFAMHSPADRNQLRSATERMKFEELYYVELHILRFARGRNETTPGHVFSIIGECFNRFFRDELPFELTGAQKRVLHEIRDDVRTGRQMNRLLQGDVGSGKTMVAFMSMLMAVDNGYQACLMAPTEILAAQHFETLKAWGDAIGVNVGLLTGSTRTSQRNEIHKTLTDGTMHILVGTHALIEESVNFLNLGLAVIDEQHRFGVAQRARLWRKNTVPPHVLVMTATPIPRTLAMTVYGDLSVSVIDELPPGRKPVTTLLRYEENRQMVYRSIYREIKAGRQVYIVYPLINENEKINLKSLEEGYEVICDTFPDCRVCCLHGRMKPDEKEYQMQLFVSGEAQIMVATTVIEVGVNVPNASVMVIENAERFGLSQLHQLRGRVGRGADQSYCVLMSRRNIGADTRKRLEIMTSTTDGFLVSEADMKLRGPGDMEGTQQSGLAFNLRLASLSSDGRMIEVARNMALLTLDCNPDLTGTRRAAPSRSSELLLSEQSRRIVDGELLRRFGPSVQWGKIS